MELIGSYAANNHENNTFVHPIFGFWFLVTFGNEATKYKNITQSLFTFCKAGWARWKKSEQNKKTNKKMV